MSFVDDGLNSDRREKLAVIERRVAHLEKLIADYRPDGNPSYSIQEVAALKWAIRCLRAAAHVSLLRRLEYTADAMALPSQQDDSLTPATTTN